MTFGLGRHDNVISWCIYVFVFITVEVCLHVEYFRVLILDRILINLDKIYFSANIIILNKVHSYKHTVISLHNK